MPLIRSEYNPKGIFKNTHFSTIYSAKIRRVPRLPQQRNRITLKDNDFIDLDLSFAIQSTKRIAILLHGMEGNAQRTYIKGQGHILTRNGWDVCAVNYRGCSGEPNLHYKSYNAGKTDDLDEVINYLVSLDKYKEISLVGFSLGGNLLLKYLGEDRRVPPEVTKAVAISTPLSLKRSLMELSKGENWVYRTSFLYDLKKKYREKAKRFPQQTNGIKINRIRSLEEFDNAYTAPAHGFKDAFDYYKKNSSLQFLPRVTKPVLILNAENDSFLSRDCYPKNLASQSKNVYLEMPKYGGHVGFYQPGVHYYSEKRVLQFFNDIY